MAADAALASSGSWFAVPAPVRDLFKRFPLHTHPPEALPARAPDPARPRARLFIFLAGDGPGDDDAPPSHNPSCLKWQTFLRIAGVDVVAVPSSNHASPSGALPFLLPAATDPRPDVPRTGCQIAQYAREHAANPLPEHRDAGFPSARHEAYLALLTHGICPAWLHALYLDPTNTPLLSALYLPSSPLLRAPLLRTLRTLRAAATAQVLAATRRPLIDPAALLADADAAFSALSALLAADDWFLGAATPGLFDAEVFAYTHLILDQRLPETGSGTQSSRPGSTESQWGSHGRALRRSLAAFENLVAHRDALRRRCWGDSS